MAGAFAAIVPAARLSLLLSETLPDGITVGVGVAIPYAAPTRYEVSGDALRASKPEVSCLLLTGSAYDGNN